MSNIPLHPYNQQELLECHRLFHGRGHAYTGLEHVCIDWLPPVALITLYKEESDDFIAQVSEQLRQKLPHCKSIQLQYRCRHKAPLEVVWGENIDALVVKEWGLNYQLQLGKAQNSGLFLDMRNGRQWVQQHAHGRNVLNLFAYTCAFSVAAVDGGASKVVNIDISKAPLAKGRDNHRLNQHDLAKVVFEGVDIFKSYSRLIKHGPYDLLICDPPSFQKGSVDVKRDYPKIIRRLPKLMHDQGLLMLCLNSPDLSEEFIYQMIEQECPQCEFIEQLSPPDVYQESMPGKGLKILIFKYHQSS
ncbi:class I SAM-dependent methyltransferase [Thalassotalea aquiviva]|uniref:class I SAM-dependent methyltransferase n=1 Tax=Thalassotalea aquiviva TaxID=3242415 RepID=UPI00352B98DA